MKIVDLAYNLGARSALALVEVVLFATGVGLGLSIVPAVTAAYVTLPRRSLPDATSLINVLQRVGGALGSALLIVILDRQLPKGGAGDAAIGAFRTTFWWVAGSAAAALWLRREQRRPARQGWRPFPHPPYGLAGSRSPGPSSKLVRSRKPNVRNSSGRRPALADLAAGSERGTSRSSRSSVNAVMVTALVALLVTAVAAALTGRAEPPATGAAAARPSTPPSAHAVAAAPAAFAGAWLGAHPQPDLGVNGQADILVDVDAHQVLWQRDPHTPRAPASLAKLVTAMVAADLAPLSRTVTVTTATDADAVRRVEPASTVMGLTASEKLTVRELLYGLFLRSGNDAAETLGGGIVPRDRFIQLMNQKAAALHMDDSHFTTPVGLDDPAMKTSPYDLAIAAATITSRYPSLLAISGTPSITIPQTGTHKQFDLVNYNKLVLPSNQYTYEGATGMKTAFTDDAGPCMVATAKRGGRRLVAVVMHSDNFFADATKLFDYGFTQQVGTRPGNGHT